MMHLRLAVPNDLTEPVMTMLGEHPAVVNLAIMENACKVPAGDLVLCDAAREGTSDVLDHLRDLGLDRRGGIAVEEIDFSLSKQAERSEDAFPGLGTDAVVWEEIEQKTSDETRLSATFLIFMIVAMVIASIGVLLDQPILIVGAMVVGPEFGPMASLCIGVVRRRADMMRRALITIGLGFVIGIVVTVLTTLLLTGLGLISRDMLLANRPLTDFIWRPDALSWVIGFLAGIAGMLSLTSAKSGALVGVLISVTTIPAAANAAVAMSYGVWHEAAGSALQMFINLAAIAVAGILTLTIQRWRQSRSEESTRAETTSGETTSGDGTRRS